MAVAECNWFEYYLTPRPGERLVEVERLRALGEDSVPLLCEHLNDPRLRVRIIAAWTLAEAGDERAFGPLCEALENADRGVSPWFRWLATCAGIFLSACVAVVAVLATLIAARLWVRGDEAESVRADWRQNMATLRGHELFLSAVIDALDRISERHPVPAARRCLPPLNRLHQDGLRHQPDTREQAKRTAHRINLATLNRHRLPVACEPPEQLVGELPMPAQELNAQVSP